MVNLVRDINFKLFLNKTLTEKESNYIHAIEYLKSDIENLNMYNSIFFSTFLMYGNSETDIIFYYNRLQKYIMTPRVYFDFIKKEYNLSFEEISDIVKNYLKDKFKIEISEIIIR